MLLGLARAGDQQGNMCRLPEPTSMAMGLTRRASVNMGVQLWAACGGRKLRSFGANP